MQNLNQGARRLMRPAAPLLRAVQLWLDAEGLRMSAAMSFYGMLSLAPLLLLLVGVLGWWVDKAYLESNLIGLVQGVMGERGAEVVRMALASYLQAAGDTQEVARLLSDLQRINPFDPLLRTRR